MNHKERIMAVFKGEKPDRIAWMPRIEHWYNVNKVQGALPAEYRGLSLLDIHSEIDAAMRLYTLESDTVYGFHSEEQPYPTPVRTRLGNDVKISIERQNDFVLTTYKTPIGTLTCKAKRCEHGKSSYPVEHRVKDIQDLKVMAFILKNKKVEFDTKAFQEWEKWLDGRGMQWYQFPPIPLQRLFVEDMGVERTIVSLYRRPSELEGFMNVIKEIDDEYYELVGNSPFEVVNIDQNLDSRFVTPSLFKKYYISDYQERTEQMHAKGKYTVCHVDGYTKKLLPLFKETGLDGLEALTVKPTGDVTLEEIKEALGDEMILVDGIPFYYFLPEISLKEFETFTRKITRMFPNNLILGISDEMPPRGDVRKLRLVSKIINEEKNRR